MSRIILSIILPLYQAETQIHELFCALKAQIGIRFNHVEIVVWDDGSRDKTSAEARKHKHLLSKYAQVRFYQSPHNRGLFATRRSATLKTSGEFITFIDKQTRPAPDYLAQLLRQNWPLVVGNPVMDKHRSAWDRVLFLLRKKLYFPYFGYDFPDLTLTSAQYRGFKNKGGGGALFVRRDWFLEATSRLSASKHSNDDSQLISYLSGFSPVRKTAKAKILYLNRTGLWENVRHLFWRGPKFIDYYLWPWNRYSPIIFAGLVFLTVQPLVFIVEPTLLAIEGVSFALGVLALSLWLAEEYEDILPTLMIAPLAVISFSLGCLLGIGIKLRQWFYASIRK